MHRRRATSTVMAGLFDDSEPNSIQVCLLPVTLRLVLACSQCYLRTSCVIDARSPNTYISIAAQTQTLPATQRKSEKCLAARRTHVRGAATEPDRAYSKRRQAGAGHTTAPRRLLSTLFTSVGEALPVT